MTDRDVKEEIEDDWASQGLLLEKLHLEYDHDTKKTLFSCGYCEPDFTNLLIYYPSTLRQHCQKRAHKKAVEEFTHEEIPEPTQKKIKTAETDPMLKAFVVNHFKDLISQGKMDHIYEKEYASLIRETVRDCLK
jgi:hypothetical protein